jgi:4-hydroxy-tetrahydrodipicolinate synthase
MTKLLTGIFPAVWTPTDKDGNLMVAELRSHLEFLKRGGVHGFMALGSTGEFPFLEVSTRRRVLEEITTAAGSLPVVGNISDIRPAVVAELGRFCRQIGTAAVAILPPWFYRMNQSDLVEFFVRAADAAQLPVVLYNFPERTGHRIELETVSAVADRVPVIGFKQSGGEFEYHRALTRLGGERKFVVFTGADTRLREAYGIGARGSISGMANAVPELMTEIFKHCEAGTPDLADLATARMKALEPLVDTLWFPYNMAALMAARGLPVGEPKEIVSEESRRTYARLVEQAGALLREWKLV